MGQKKLNVLIPFVNPGVQRRIIDVLLMLDMS